MDIYGINNISNNELNYNYDKHYKQVALKLKQAKTEEERKIIRSTEQKNLSTSNSIKINIEELKELIRLYQSGELAERDSFRTR